MPEPEAPEVSTPGDAQLCNVRLLAEINFKTESDGDQYGVCERCAHGLRHGERFHTFRDDDFFVRFQTAWANRLGRLTRDVRSKGFL